MSRLDEILADNTRRVRDRIAEAADRCGRAAADVRLVAVTKYVDADVARRLLQQGCTDLGENRPQLLWEKAEALQDAAVQWHYIGHLQRNKVRRTLPLIQWLHALDSVRLIETVNAEAARLGRRIRTLLEVNVSGDVEKHGFSPPAARQLAPQLHRWEHISIEGLMTMAARASDAESARTDFVALRELRDTLQPLCPAGVRLEHLSMGMSRDFEAAIEEGATMVRIGSVLYEGIL